MIFLTALVKLFASAPVLACAVCGSAVDQANTIALLKGTALLSLMPLAVIGGTIFYIYKVSKAARLRDAAALMTPSTPLIETR